MTHVRGPLFIAAAATAGLLSACGAETTGTATPGSTETTTTTASSKETGMPTAAPVAAGGDATAPGTKLKVGVRAVIPYASGEKKGTIAVTLTAIEPGAKEDLATFGARTARAPA